MRPKARLDFPGLCTGNGVIVRRTDVYEQGVESSDAV